VLVCRVLRLMIVSGGLRWVVVVFRCILSRLLVWVMCLFVWVEVVL